MSGWRKASDGLPPLDKHVVVKTVGSNRGRRNAEYWDLPDGGWWWFDTAGYGQRVQPGDEWRYPEEEEQ